MSDLLETIKKLKGEKPGKEVKGEKKSSQTILPFIPSDKLSPDAVFDFSRVQIAPESNKVRHVSPEFRTIVTDKPLTTEQVEGVGKTFDEIQQEKEAQETAQEIQESTVPLQFRIGEKVYDAVKSSTTEVIDGLKKLYGTPVEFMTKDMSPREVVDNLVQGYTKPFLGSMGVMTGLTMTPIEEVVKTTPVIGKPAVDLAHNLFQMIGETGQFPMEIALQTLEKTTGKEVSPGTRQKLLETADALTQLAVGEKVGRFIKEAPVRKSFKEIENRVATIVADEMIRSQKLGQIKSNIVEAPLDQGVRELTPEAPDAFNIPTDRRRRAKISPEALEIEAPVPESRPINLENVDKRDVLEGYVPERELIRRERELEAQAIRNIIDSQPFDNTNITRGMIDAEMTRMRSTEKPTFKKEDVVGSVPDEMGQRLGTETPSIADEFIKYGEKDPVTSAFNLEKINTLDDVKNWFDYAEQNYKSEFDAQRRGQISQGTTKKVGNDIAEQISKTISTPPGTVLNPETTFAMRQLLTKGAQELTEFSKTLPAEMTYEQMAGFKERLFKFLAMAKSVSGLRSEAGRLLNQWKIPVDGEINVMNVLADELKRLNVNDPNVLDAVYTKVSPNLWDKAYYAYYNTILSSPFTDMANIIGNSTNFGFNMVAGMLFNPKAIPNIIRSTSRKLKESRKDIADIHHGEKFEQSKFLEGGRKTWQAYDLPTNNNLQKWIRTAMPITRLKMEDNFFRKMFEGLETGIQATKIAKKEGLKFEQVYNELQVPEIQSRIERLQERQLKSQTEVPKITEEISTLTKQLESILTDPEYTNLRSKNYKEVLEGIYKFSEYGVFQTPLKSRMGYALQNPGEHWWAVPLKVIMPFVKTPANIIKVGLEATPLGFVKLLGKEGAKLTPMERGQIVRRAVTGSLFNLAIMKMIGDGILEITGSGNIRKEQQETLVGTGWKPNSIILNLPNGDKKAMSYQNINPFNIIFGVIGNLSDGIKYGKLDDDEDSITQALTKATLNMAYTLTDMSMLRSLGDLLKAFDPNNPNENYFTDIVENTIAQPIAIPKTGFDYYRTLFGDEETAKLRYKTDALGEQFLSRIGVSSRLLPELNRFGQQKQGINERFPIPKSYRFNQLNEWLLENKINVGYPDKTIQINKKPYKLSDTEYNQYLFESGQEILDKLTTDFPKFQNKTGLDAKKEVEKIVSEAREKARKKFKPIKQREFYQP